MAQALTLELLLIEFVVEALSLYLNIGTRRLLDFVLVDSNKSRDKKMDLSKGGKWKRGASEKWESRRLVMRTYSPQYCRSCLGLFDPCVAFRYWLLRLGGGLRLG